MDFKDILKKNGNSFEVFLGYDGEDNFSINLKERPSIVITGSSGTSKSIMLHEILLQLINKNKSDELKIIPIASTKVELQDYASSPYAYDKIISDEVLALKKIEEVISEIHGRKKLFNKNGVSDFDSYNNLDNTEKLPFIVVAIDEALDILKLHKSTKDLLKLITECPNHGVSLIMNTNSVHSDFFEDDINIYASCKISFDFVIKEQAKLNNLENSESLLLRNFLVRLNNGDIIKEYTIYEFDYSDIDLVLYKN